MFILIRLPMNRFMLACLIVCFYNVSHAQYYFYNGKYFDKDVIVQVGVSANAMNCITDLGDKAIDIKNFKPAGGIYTGVLYRDVIGARLEATWGSVTATDAHASQPDLLLRNLNFTSNITEIDLLAELHPFNIKYRPDGLPALSPYLLAGAGIFSFDPKAKLNGQYYFLQRLHTEGQGFAETGRPNYKLSQLIIPLGGGLAYELSELFTIKGEALYRILNTDYLDDVSTTYIDPALFDKYLSPYDAALVKQLYFRSNEITNDGSLPAVRRGSKKKDAYYSINIKVEITLGRAKRSR